MSVTAAWVAGNVQPNEVRAPAGLRPMVAAVPLPALPVPEAYDTEVSSPLV